MISNIFSQQYLFELAFRGLSRSDRFIFIFSLLLLAGAIATAIYKRSLKNKLFKIYLQRWVNFFTTIGLAGVIWTGLRYEMIQIFSTHFTIMVVFAIGLVWIFVLIRDYFKKYKLQVAEAMRQQQLQKYM